MAVSIWRSSVMTLTLCSVNNVNLKRFQAITVFIIFISVTVRRNVYDTYDKSSLSWNTVMNL